MKMLLLIVFNLIFVSTLLAQKKFEKDTIKTSQGDLEITFIGHATLMFAYAGKIIHVDPVGSEADYAKLPKADLILVTHEHSDHYDPIAIKQLSHHTTTLVVTDRCVRQGAKGLVMKNGETKTVAGLEITAVPAYNILHKRDNGQPFHPKGVGNGYVITFGDKKVYIAGDTENISEMAKLKNIAVAFLPMNLPYTMTPKMVAEAAKRFKPQILYPYHFGQTKTDELVALLKENPEIEVRVRPMP